MHHAVLLIVCLFKRTSRGEENREPRLVTAKEFARITTVPPTNSIVRLCGCAAHAVKVTIASVAVVCTLMADSDVTSDE